MPPRKSRRSRRSSRKSRRRGPPSRRPRTKKSKTTEKTMKSRRTRTRLSGGCWLSDMFSQKSLNSFAFDGNEQSTNAVKRKIRLSSGNNSDLEGYGL